MSTEETDRTPLYVVIGFYLTFLFGIALYGLKKKKEADDAISEHFLASKSFGVILLFLTTFSTMVSGYTAVGIPNEAAALGYMVFRWLGIFINILLGFVIFAPRIRRLSIARNYQSPNDILADRFNCNSLRLLGAFSICAPQILYTAAQFLSLKGLLQVVLPDIDPEGGAWFLVLFIYTCEVIGGFRSVSLTDAIQSCIMCFAFIVMPMVLLYHFGGYAGINGPSCQNAVMTNVSTVNITTNITTYAEQCTSGCIQCVKPIWNYGPPSQKSNSIETWPDGSGSAEVDSKPFFNYVAMDMWGFAFSGLGAVFTPHWVQRLMSAKRDQDLKIAVGMMIIAGLFCLFPNILLGLTRAAIYPEESGQAFAIMVDKLIAMGGFTAFIAVIACVSGIAAFMSTADSAVMGISNVITIEWFQNFLTPNKSVSFHLYLSKAISLIAIIISRCVLYDVGGFVKMIRWQMGMGWAVVPPYVFALFISDKYCSAYPVLCGLVAHYIVLFCLELQAVENGKDVFLYPPIWGAVASFTITPIVHMMLPKDMQDDHKREGADALGEPAKLNFGGGEDDPLDHDKIMEVMSTTVEPTGNTLGRVLIVLSLVLQVFGLPLYGDGGWDVSQANDVKDGLPPWTQVLIATGGLSYACCLGACMTWKTMDGTAANKVVAVGKGSTTKGYNGPGPNKATDDNKAISWGQNQRKESAGNVGFS